MNRYRVEDHYEDCKEHDFVFQDVKEWEIGKNTIGFLYCRKCATLHTVFSVEQ